MKIAPFGVEIWMSDYETRCRYNLAETCRRITRDQRRIGYAGNRQELIDGLPKISA